MCVCARSVKLASVGHKKPTQWEPHFDRVSCKLGTYGSSHARSLRSQDRYARSACGGDTRLMVAELRMNATFAPQIPDYAVRV